MTTTRKPVPLEADTLQLLDEARRPGTAIHTALQEVLGTEKIGVSEAAVLKALVRVGQQVVQERALQHGYAQFAAELEADPQHQQEREARRQRSRDREAARSRAGI